jgi:hypothetical protein
MLVLNSIRFVSSRGYFTLTMEDAETMEKHTTRLMIRELATDQGHLNQMIAQVILDGMNFLSRTSGGVNTSGGNSGGVAEIIPIKPEND